ncbi:hypothetical protein BV898_17385 [Hypsibius exemplaris]|uniref:PIN domain-containing protein n=1 Tax=Hypsibius exemplaris TaxID=2072580 RepID=A0A9X6NHK9_HYPEX|nr:hypothetical protein BV898_17385 [Hypsibius exemplaris]
MSVERKEPAGKEAAIKASKSLSRSDLQASKFQGLLSVYEEQRIKLENLIARLDSTEAITDWELRNARLGFISLTTKAIRKDPKLLKSKYEDVFWRSVMYPLVRGASDKPEIQSSPKYQAAFQDLLTSGCAAFRGFIETFLVRFELKITGMEDLSALCEACASGAIGKFKPEHVIWIRSFLSRCLCSIGDLYRYSASFDQKSYALASHYYEIAELTRPSDGRAISCLGIVQKELGEPFTATFYCLLSACKKNRYGYYLKNLEVMKGPVYELCVLHGVETEKPRLDDDPREIIKVFSVHVLNIVHGLLLDDDLDVTRMRARFSSALDYLSATLERPAPDAGSWKSAHYTTTSYLHPNLLWKVCAMVIAVYHLKRTEVDVKRGDHLGTLCAFIVAMFGKITSCIVDNLRHWISYTSFNLVPEPDTQIVVRELEKLRQLIESKSPKKSDSSTVVSGTSFPDAVEECGSGDAPGVLGPSSSRFELDLDLQSMEEYWHDSRLDDTSEYDFDSADYSAEEHSSMGTSYLQAFLGFMDTQMHLPLMSLLFQWIRCDTEMWGFCLVNFPDIICNVVDIVNLLCIPKFVEVYVNRNGIGSFPLEEELFLRDTLPLQDWLDRLDWSGWHTRPGGLSETEKMILLVHRFNDMTGVLEKCGVATYDSIHKNWRCNLQRKQIGAAPDTGPKIHRKLEMAMRLGKAFQAEENKTREKGYMARRSDLPKYIVIDTSCLVRKLNFVQRLYDCKKFKIVIPAYVLEELDRGKKNRNVRDAIRWMDQTTETKDLGRLEIQRWKDMHQHDADLQTDWDRLTNTERSVRVMVDCTKFFSQEVKRRLTDDDDPEYGLNILVLTDLDLQSVYCARVIEQMERLEVPHEIKLMRIHDFMGWLDEGPEYFRRLQEQEERDRLA